MHRRKPIKLAAKADRIEPFYVMELLEQAREIVRKLRAEGIATAPRDGWVRASPHFYISPEDIETMLGNLP